jgi:hypothetical protein
MTPHLCSCALLSSQEIHSSEDLFQLEPLIEINNCTSFPQKRENEKLLL